MSNTTNFYKELYDTVNSDKKLLSELSDFKDLSIESFCNILIFKMTQLECFSEMYNIVSLVKNTDGYFLKINNMDHFSNTNSFYIEKTLYGVDDYNNDDVECENDENEFFLNFFERKQFQLETYRKSSKKNIRKLLNILNSDSDPIDVFENLKNEFNNDSSFSSFVFYKYMLGADNNENSKFIEKVFLSYSEEKKYNDNAESFFKGYNCEIPDKSSSVLDFVFKISHEKNSFIKDIQDRYGDFNFEGLSSDFFLSKLRKEHYNYTLSKDIEIDIKVLVDKLKMDINLSEILDKDISQVEHILNRYISLFVEKDENLLLKPKFTRNDKIDFEEVTIDNFKYKNARYNFLYDDVFLEYSNRNIFSYNHNLEDFLSGGGGNKTFHKLVKNGDIIASFLTKEISVFDEFMLYMSRTSCMDLSKENKTHKIIKVYDLNIDSRYRADEKLLNYTINSVFKLSKKKNRPIFLSLNSTNDPSYTSKISLKFSEISRKKGLFYVTDDYKRDKEDPILKKIKNSDFLNYLYNNTHDYQFLHTLQSLKSDTDSFTRKKTNKKMKN